VQIHPLHNWHLSPAQAVRIQHSLASRIIDSTPLDLTAIRTVAGVDVSVKNNVSQAAIVVLRFPTFEVLEIVRAQRPTTFPYITGLLSFREGPVLEDAFTRVQTEPDVLLFDGMGRIHPRRIGIAAHMGLWLERPTIGVGKTHLIGTYDAVPETRGGFALLRDRGEVLGAVLRTRERVKPVYVSVGHRADLDSALALVMACTTRYRLPEPIRAAHNAAGQF
jgi:deoxyribonuclease V